MIDANTFKFKPNDHVRKTGLGYSGPGVVMIAFVGWDQHVRYVVAHKIDGGTGEFYHIYGEGQLTRIMQ